MEFMRTEVAIASDVIRSLWRNVVTALLIACLGCLISSDLAAEQVDPDTQFGSAGLVVKNLDTTLYLHYRPYVEREMEIACDTCFGPEVRDGIRELRRSERTGDEIDYVANSLSRELESSEPNWAIVSIALKAAEFGMAHDSRVRQAASDILTDLASLPNTAVAIGAASRAAGVLGASGEEEDSATLISLLTEAALSDSSDGFTRERRLLGYRIVDSLAIGRTRQGAIANLEQIKSTIEGRAVGATPFEQRVLATVQDRLQEVEGV